MQYLCMYVYLAIYLPHQPKKAREDNLLSPCASERQSPVFLIERWLLMHRRKGYAPMQLIKERMWYGVVGIVGLCCHLGWSWRSVDLLYGSRLSK